jgi:ribosome-associated protein YbcJ (S4-like RNA binding protein)
MSIVYITKSVNADLTCNYDGSFQYPSCGSVEAPDWKPEAKCGNGLHGFLWGEGYGGLAELGENSKWLLIRVDVKDGFVELNGKVKFRRGKVVFVGSCAEVAEELKKYLPTDRVYSVIGSTLTGGCCSTLTGGDGSTLTGGDGATLSILYYNVKKNKWRRKFAVVGEDGIKPNVQYKLDENFNFVKVKP